MEAERFYERSLAILEISLGPAHPSVATSLNNLAVVQFRQVITVIYVVSPPGRGICFRTDRPRERTHKVFLFFPKKVSLLGKSVKR